MIADAQLQLSNAQAVTSTAVSTNTIDLGVARDIGPNEDLVIVITVDEAVAAVGAATVTFQVISSAAAALTSPTVLVQTDAIPKTELTVGRRPMIMRIARAILSTQLTGQRYLGMQYTVATGPLTAGKFTVNLAPDAQDISKYYPSGFAVA